MTTVIMDFKKDWMEFLDKEMTVLGLKYDGKKSLEENTVAYFNSKRKLMNKKPRTVHESKELRIPSEYIEAYRILKNLISRGEDVTPYLSRRTKDAHCNDLLLNAWGIHHLHFLPEGTKEVLFVMFTDEDAFVIQVLPHGRDHKDVWVNTSLVEILHNNWPAAIAGRRIAGVSGENLTATERLNIRNAHGNVAVSVSDGTCYAAMGGGIMSSGTCFSDLTTSDKLIADLAYWEELVRVNEAGFRTALNISESDPLNIRLMFEGRECWLYEPDRRIRFYLKEP